MALRQKQIQSMIERAGMTTFLICNWQKFTKFLYYAICTSLIILVYACGEGNYSYSETETGSIAFSVEWGDAPTIGEDGTTVGMVSAASLDCVTAGVVTVALEIYDGNDNYLVGESFACSLHTGTVDNVPPGLNRKLVVLGEDSHGTALYRGEVTGLTVTAGQISNAGTVVVEFQYPIVGSVERFAYGVYVSGSYAYVAHGNDGLLVLDISDPTSPTVVGGVDTSGIAYNVHVSGSYAYVASGSGGLQIVDISDPESPTIVSSVATPAQALGVYVSGSSAYVAGGDSGLHIMDISDPANPGDPLSYDTPGTAWDVYVAGDEAGDKGCVADGSDGLTVMYVQPGPAITGSVDTPGEAYGVYISGDYAYVADGDSGLHIIDISDPENPILFEYVNTPGTAWDVHVSGSYAYVADGDGGLQVIMISETMT